MEDIVDLPPMEMLPDENGFIDRACPNEDCLFNFKIDAADWKSRVDGNEMICPRCGHRDSSDQWYTAAQLEAVQENADSFALGMVSDCLDDIFGSFARDLNESPGQLSASYIPGARPEYADLPIEQSEGWATEITCDRCNTRFSVIGNAFFCPCCGKDLTTNSIFDSLSSYRQRIDDLPKLREWFSANCTAEETERQISLQREDILKSLVGVFEAYAKNRYAELGGTPPKGNAFQRVSDGSNLFCELTRKRYNDFIGDSGVNDLNMLVNRRHILTHSNGFVDKHYLRNSGDTSYQLGQRIVVKDSDLNRLFDLIEGLVQGLSSVI